MRRLSCLYTSFGSANYIGEELSILQHSLQCAALASTEYGGKDDEIVAAALLHDVGHVLGLEAGLEPGMGGCGVTEHEKIGASFLKTLGFKERVCRLVESHVIAKRYLCYADSSYYDKLSAASKTTLSFQGGVMSAAEAAVFEADADRGSYVKMRLWDESAKVPNLEVPPLESYLSLLQMCREGSASDEQSSYALSPCQLSFFNSNGYVKITNFLPIVGLSPSDLQRWVHDIESWEAHTDASYLIHFEQVDGGRRQLCRAENFADYHADLGAFSRGAVLSLCTQLFGEAAVLFKEKINFKLPGGAGFAPHQDSPAYIGLADSHISVMVCVDASTIANGCLEVSPGRYSKGEIPLDFSGVITAEAADKLLFRPVECNAGDIVLFDGYVPHRSDSNNSDGARRGMFITYNKGREGDVRAAYYDAKRKGREGFSAGSAISFQGDFRGVVVD